jgi:hypothetical protein
MNGVLFLIMLKSRQSEGVRGVWVEVAARAAPLGVASALLFGGVVGCGGVAHPLAAPPAVLPVHEQVHAAAEKAWDGLQALDAACARAVRADTTHSQFEDGSGLSKKCLAMERPAEIDRRLLVAALESWRPESASRVGCYVTGILDAYEGMLAALEPRGYLASPQVEEGRASAAWIASLSSRRGGRCGS